MSSKLNLVEVNQVNEGNRDVIDQLECELKKIEVTLKAELETLEKSMADHLQREPQVEEPSVDRNSLLGTTNRIITILKRFARVREAVLEENGDLRKQLKDQQFLLEEVEMERNVLLQQVHAYLETNSSLRVRLEEQRCQTGTLQRQLNADLESRIKSLEYENEELNDLNTEKDKQIHKITVMLEQTAKCLKNKETEVLNRKNKENNLVTLLKADLQKTSEEKRNIEEKYVKLKERFEDYFFRNVSGLVLGAKNSLLKKSLSVGDLSWTNINISEKNIMSDFPVNGLCPRQFFKKFEDERRWTMSESFDVMRADFLREGLISVIYLNNVAEEKLRRPTACRVHALRPRHQSGARQGAGERMKTPSVHAQLNSLGRDLLNLTKRLESLKCQLKNSGVIKEESKPSENRSLKRKANPMEESSGDNAEEQKSEFRNLKNILQDAKKLNAKLQNLREEKQKMIDLNKKEVGVQVTEKKNDEFSETAQEVGPLFGICKTR